LNNIKEKKQQRTTIMRFQVLITALMAAIVSGRRGSPAPPAPSRHPHHFQQFGWGIEGPLYPKPEDLPEGEKVKKVREVKRGEYKLSKTYLEICADFE